MRAFGFLALAAVSALLGCGVPRDTGDRDAGSHTCPDGGSGCLHQSGVINEKDPVTFHGVLLRDVKYRLESCAVCHGADLRGASAPTCYSCHEQGPQLAGKCGSCHDRPPADNHPMLGADPRPCVACHRGTVVDNDKLLQGGLHMNGKSDVGDGSGKCGTCHGSASNAAPDTGAHQAHLQARHKLSAPVPCAACHDVPLRVDSPGHIDDTPAAEVFPAGVTLARADGATAKWERTTGRCSDVYCHGGGARAMKDSAASLARTPVWGTPGQASCGTCHGVPPRDADHTATMRLIDCARCHPDTIDATGALRVTAGQSAHINGVVDVTR